MEIVIVAAVLILMGIPTYFLRKEKPRTGMQWEDGRWVFPEDQQRTPRPPSSGRKLLP